LPPGSSASAAQWDCSSPANKREKPHPAVSAARHPDAHAALIRLSAWSGRHNEPARRRARPVLLLHEKALRARRLWPVCSRRRTHSRCCRARQFCRPPALTQKDSQKPFDSWCSLLAAVDDPQHPLRLDFRRGNGNVCDALTRHRHVALQPRAENQTRVNRETTYSCIFEIPAPAASSGKSSSSNRRAQSLPGQTVLPLSSGAESTLSLTARAKAYMLGNRTVRRTLCDVPRKAHRRVYEGKIRLSPNARGRRPRNIRKAEGADRASEAIPFPKRGIPI